MIKTLLTLERFSDNKLMERREQWSRSWLKHFMDLLYCQLSKLTLATNDIGSVSRTVSATATAAGIFNGTFCIVSVPGGQTLVIPATTSTGATWNDNISTLAVGVGENLGIVVGTGGGAVTPGQDALQAKIAHGQAAGELMHGGTDVYDLSFVNPNGQFTIRRRFSNVLGGAVTIQEIGIYAQGTVGAGTGWLFCIARDVVAPGLTINNGEILEATYTPQITV